MEVEGPQVRPAELWAEGGEGALGLQREGEEPAAATVPPFPHGPQVGGDRARPLSLALSFSRLEQEGRD